MESKNENGTQAAAGAQRKRVFSAEYPFKCEKCHQQHPKGTRALFIEKDGKRFVAAADCYWPNRAATKSSDAVATGEGGGVKTSPPLPEFPKPLEDDQIDQFLIYALNHVAKHFNTSIADLSTENELVALVFRAKLQQQEQLFNVKLNRLIAAQKTGNIEKVQQSRR